MQSLLVETWEQNGHSSSLAAEWFFIKASCHGKRVLAWLLRDLLPAVVPVPRNAAVGDWLSWGLDVERQFHLGLFVMSCYSRSKRWATAVTQHPHAAAVASNPCASLTTVDTSPPSPPHPVHNLFRCVCKSHHFIKCVVPLEFATSAMLRHALFACVWNLCFTTECGNPMKPHYILLTKHKPQSHQRLQRPEPAIHTLSRQCLKWHCHPLGVQKKNFDNRQRLCKCIANVLSIVKLKF